MSKETFGGINDGLYPDLEKFLLDEKNFHKDEEQKEELEKILKDYQDPRLPPFSNPHYPDMYNPLYKMG